MSASAVHLDGREHLIGKLEGLLQKAKDGRIKSIAYAVVNDDNSITTGWRMNNRVDGAFVSAGVSDLAFRIAYQRHAVGDEE